MNTRMTQFDDASFNRWMVANKVIGSLFAAALVAIAAFGYAAPAPAPAMVVAKQEISLAPYAVMASAALDQLIARGAERPTIPF